MPADPLQPLVDLPGVAAAVERARVACEELRWHEAFRRRWREVRAESGVRAARASAELEGARVTLDVVRAVALGDAGADARLDAPGAVVAGAVPATALVEQLMADLGGRDRPLPPWPQLLARVHAAAGAGWLPADDLGRVRRGPQSAAGDLAGLGPALAPDEASARLALLVRTLDATSAPALVVAAVLHAELLVVRPFVAANGLVARAAARLVVTSRGLDPTGSVQPETAWAARPQQYLAAAAGFAAGTDAGVAGGVSSYADAVVAGARCARDVADEVLAGRRA
ncbi:Fic family protein [Cellulomonas sp. HZM]|uniref:Fic family protein n=1 Tax=Cellulomonas sp. HZM TaxID=1454010 RepID=UPI0004939B6F|nr:Fic family protein [Cellulomonas sp. HZM]